MSEKKEEWEIGYSQENPQSTLQKAKTVDFEKPDSIVGQSLENRFLIEKDLTDGGADAGGIGLVYLAKDLKLLSRDVVVKILQKSSLGRENIVRKFQHEIEALIRLDHPNIVRILDSGTLSDGNPFMVMEFVAGGSLRRKLRERGRLPLEESAYLIENIAAALGAAHSKKILHRDVKPENIMLTPQEDGADRVRLIDFGIARVEDPTLAPATSIAQTVGTVLYMAPEQLEGKIEQTAAADIYALAVMAYEMLTGELPFQPNSLYEMFSLQQLGVQKTPRQLRLEMPPEADQLIMQALILEPEARPQDARKFGKELAAALRLKPNYRADYPVENNLQTTEIGPPIQIPAEDKPTKHFEDPIISELPEENRGGGKNFLFAGLGALILLILATVGGFLIWKNLPDKSKSDEPKTANATTEKVEKSIEKTNDTPPVSLAFYLNVQKMRDGKPYEEPFKSSGQEIFENGYKFKINVSAENAGTIYLFNEDKDAQGKTVYNILYPTPKTNGGSAQISAKQPVETNFNTFGGTRGTEIVWIVWTKAARSEPEAAKQAAFDQGGTVKDENNTRQLTDFLQKYALNKTQTAKDSTNQQTIISGNGDIIVHRLELEHR